MPRHRPGRRSRRSPRCGSECGRCKPSAAGRLHPARLRKRTAAKMTAAWPAPAPPTRRDRWGLPAIPAGSALPAGRWRPWPPGHGRRPRGRRAKTRCRWRSAPLGADRSRTPGGRSHRAPGSTALPRRRCSPLRPGLPGAGGCTAPRSPPTRSRGAAGPSSPPGTRPRSCHAHCGGRRGPGDVAAAASSSSRPFQRVYGVFGVRAETTLASGKAAILPPQPGPLPSLFCSEDSQKA